MDESVVKEFEEQQVGKLKLSQAIRIGAKLRPQNRSGSFYSPQGATCAIAAAAHAVYGDPKWAHQYANEFINAHPGVRVLSLIYDMNDNGKTREQIADWLEAQGY